MVVDDSAIVRGLIVQTLERDPALSVVARAAHGEAALIELARTPVDVVVLDIEMPVMDGLTALPLILQRQPDVKVVMASTLTRRNARISLQALQAGAADYVPKPETGGLVGADDFARELVAKVKALGQGRGRRDTSAKAPTVAAPVVRPSSLSPPVRPRVVAIGGSTGAPPALMSLFSDLKGGLEQAVLLTQHMPPTFTTMLAEQFPRELVSPDQPSRLGLGHIVGGPGLQRLQADAGVSPRQGRGHDHLHVRLALQDQGQGGQPVHHRHLDVQHHHVDGGARQLNQRRLAIGGAGHDAQRRVAFQRLHDQAAHNGAVVHDHDANAAIPRGRGDGVRQGDLSSRLHAVHNS